MPRLGEIQKEKADDRGHVQCTDVEKAGLDEPWNFL